ncbi:MAG TPA: DUF4288 domain-containing protein [Flavitalea sp.]|nr:DUF4288 domain-containing protein [Flavitalea sp.]
MQWYIAKIVFRIISGDGNHTPQFDEQLRLIMAANELEAFEQARELGLSEQDEFENVNNSTVEWRFIDIAEMKRFPTLANGVELYSRIMEEEDADRYTDVIQKKAEHIRERLHRNLLQPI